MQTIEISDDIATQLNIIALKNHISNSDLVEDLIKSYLDEAKKINNLKDFFEPFQKDISDFKFNRDEANAR